MLYLYVYLFPNVRGYLRCGIEAAVQPSYLSVGVLSSASQVKLDASQVKLDSFIQVEGPSGGARKLYPFVIDFKVQIVDIVDLFCCNTKSEN